LYAWHVRGLLGVVFICALATPVAAQLAMSSSRFSPPTAEEKAVFDRASRDVMPADVRREPARYANTIVFWTGVTAGRANGVAFVEHHYFDNAVEGHGGVWLSPWGEGRFCVLDAPSEAKRRFDSERPLFVRAYGVPVMTPDGVCLQRAVLIVGDRGYSTTMIEYGPNGNDVAELDVQARGATRSHPEERLMTRFGYRVHAGIHGGDDFGDLPGGGGWNIAVELDLRFSLRSELALMTGPHWFPSFSALTSWQIALLYRYYVVGIGAAFGPLLHLPMQDTEKVWIGGRYMPMMGDAVGRWGVSPVLGGALDIAATTDGDVRILLGLTLGIDGNLGSPLRR